MSLLQEYKCPCCGGAIAFDSGIQKMKCPFCDTEFEMEALAAYDSELASNQTDDMNWETAAGGEWQEGEADGLRSFVCKSCGGEIVGDENTAATSCPFCGNPVVMRDVRRIRMHCILLVFLIVISALAGCSGKQPAEENGSIQMDESAVHDFSKRKDEVLTGTAPDKSEKSFMSEEATTSLTEFRHEMDGTTYLFATAYLGYVGEPTEHPAEWIQEICPQIMVDYPFIKEISGKQIVGSIGDLYCIVPRDSQTSVMIRQMIDEEDAAGGAKKAGDVLYRGEVGMPVLLFCNEFRYWDRADVEISVEGADGKQAVWQPMLDEAEYIALPQNGDGEFLAMDFTYYPDGDINFGDMTPMGWYAPDLENLRETTWSTYQESDEGERTIYYLDLYGGEQADYGEYDGEACFAWQYGDEEGCQEYYEGWWRLEEVDGQMCLRLDICRIGGIMYREGEKPKVISNQFPVLCDSEGLNMILHKGIQNGESLPFLNEQTDFEFLSQPVG